MNENKHMILNNTYARKNIFTKKKDERKTTFHMKATYERQ